ncbi:hypothetical protein FNL56_03040 [Tardiphaga sp. vice304]|uniref:hypothetical protein n=1 Tax=Tardiphaga sp. vice304 TaxID=2592817 RepID=UPI001162C549|nr:hypothetical protein [Tardiphaga sp. vice304]QDM25238.1 hypothetical protein FNL56_03040 [Tardiphaga sp. vice304]
MAQRMAMIAAVVLGLATPAAISAYVAAPARGEGWQDIAWPFPRDGWPPGRAYRCAAASCGAEMELYIRPKIGFCNCDSGVADDDEVDRVADLDLISPRFRPLQHGDVVRIADMPGRARHYDLADGTRRQAVGMAVSRKCDLMVAVVQGRAGAAELQSRALHHLASQPADVWMKWAMTGG